MAKAMAEANVKKLDKRADKGGEWVPASDGEPDQS